MAEKNDENSIWEDKKIFSSSQNRRSSFFRQKKLSDKIPACSFNASNKNTALFLWCE
jgi:hypothetical protein